MKSFACTSIVSSLVLLLVGCIDGDNQLSKFAAVASCAPPPGEEVIWVEDQLRFVLVGEVHGTSEIPAAFGELVCSAAQTGISVLVGLEFPEEVRPAFEAYLASAGTADNRESFLRGSGWLAMAHEYPDGRTSEAMLNMVERLRTLRAAGLAVSVTTFVQQILPGSQNQTAYEIGLATSLHDAEKYGAYDLTIVLVGNLHARRTPVDLSEASSFEPMAMHLPEESTLTLNAVTGGGEAWICQAECGPHHHAGGPIGLNPGIKLGNGLAPGYDGIVAVGPVTASLPIRDGVL